MRLHCWFCAFVALSSVATPAAAQRDTAGVRGSRVSLQVVSAGRTELHGELIAVSADSLWLLDETGLVGLRLDQVRSASLRRHTLNGRVGLIWTLVGGLVTGGALTAACSSVSDGCGSVFLGTMLTWGIVGGISALSMEISSRLVLPAPRIGERLGSYARFPQGLPPQLHRESLGQQLELRARIPLPFR